ncbi:MAG: mandelate racemase/muconate lactonizing enzyme family protein [Rhodobacteraceae bacterium]|nr:mandelate racemase/muconate lactonizing enzyme family protein [Paracoccaceae bacterium]
MKITKLRTQMVDVPLEKRVKSAIHDIVSVGCVLIYLETDQGLVGQSYLFTINANRLKAFDAMVKGFAHHVEGQDPHYVTAIWDAIWTDINPTGHEGVTVSALSALDTALWDLIGKVAERPLHHVFGACRDRIRTYASGGLWMSSSTEELVSEATDFVALGFRAMKVRVGKPNLEEDVARVRAVREAVGPDIEILTDANQSLTPKYAIRLGRRLQELNVGWLEEPVARHHLKGHRQVV